MRTVRRPAALAAALCLAASMPAGAAQQTTITKFSGSTTTGGTWTRTIIDVSEPNKTTAASVVVNYLSGTTDVQMANLYKNACNSTLPSPINNPNGYQAVFNQGSNKQVRLSKQAGTYNFSDAGLPSTCKTTECFAVATTVPSTVEDAPIASDGALATLAIGLAAIAGWTRRRRRTA